MILFTGCAEDYEYDLSTPDRTIDSMKQMIEDGRADQLVTVIHIQPRDITFADGVTEASAIENVLDKTAELLGQLHRVSKKLHQRFPDQVLDEAQFAGDGFAFIFGGRFEKIMSEVLTDPFGFLREQRERITTMDMGDGTAAILWDGEAALGGIGLQMREVGGQWKIDIPIDAPPLSEYRPETREEWAVVASLMLSLENALRDFEARLDDGKFRTLADAAGEAGRMLGSSTIVQGAIYAFMKRKAEEEGS